MKKYVAASLCMMVIAACAAGGMKASKAPSTMPAETGGAPSQQGSPDVGGTPKQELDALYNQLEQDRAKAQVPEAQLPPGPQTLMMSEQPDRSPKTDPTCKPAPSDSCNTSCTLSGSICKNKNRICELAKDLGDDDSIGKCNKAEKTCKTSADKCCSCML